jgi:hypothetical protein
MDLSIIIVNRNSRDYLGKCIASILDNTHGIVFEIVVIDNASFDGTGEMLRECYPQVRYIQRDTNLGFAKANNAAFLESRGRNVLFLNPDTEIVGEAVTILLGHLKELPNAGVVGCRLLNADGSVQTSCIQSFPTILNQSLDSELLRSYWPKSSLWGNAALYGGQDEPMGVEAISGACLMLKRSVFHQVGLFSEEYFMYTEDIDLSYKSRRSGYRNYYVPDATIIHFGGGSTKKESRGFQEIMMRESIWRFLGKTKGKYYGFVYKVCMLISAVGRLIILSISFPLRLVRPETRSPGSPFRKWWAILGWSLGLAPSRYVRNRRQTQL